MGRIRILPINQLYKQIVTAWFAIHALETIKNVLKIKKDKVATTPPTLLLNVNTAHVINHHHHQQPQMHQPQMQQLQDNEKKPNFFLNHPDFFDLSFTL